MYSAYSTAHFGAPFVLKVTSVLFKLYKDAAAGTSLNVVDPIHLIRSMQRLPRIVMIDPIIPKSARQYGAECIAAPALQGVCDWIVEYL